MSPSEMQLDAHFSNFCSGWEEGNFRSHPALPRHLNFGIFLEVRENPQKIIFEGDIKTTNPVVAKSYKKQKITVVGFIIVTPICSHVFTCGGIASTRR